MLGLVVANVPVKLKARFRPRLADVFGRCNDFYSQLDGDVTLQHRIKEPYSMWRKMQRQGGGVDSVYDAVALRVVIKARRVPGETEEAHQEKSRQLCYHVRITEGDGRDSVTKPVKYDLELSHDNTVNWQIFPMICTECLMFRFGNRV